MIFFLVLDPSICHSLWLLRLSNSRSCLEVFINVSNVSYKSCALLWFAKKGKYLLEKKTKKNQAYLVVALKLDVPKIGMPLSKWS